MHLTGRGVEVPGTGSISIERSAAVGEKDYVPICLEPEFKRFRLKTKGIRRINIRFKDRQILVSSGAIEPCKAASLHLV